MEEMLILESYSWGRRWGPYWEGGRRGYGAGGTRSRDEKGRMEKEEAWPICFAYSTVASQKVCHNLCRSYKENPSVRITPPSQLASRGYL